MIINMFKEKVFYGRYSEYVDFLCKEQRHENPNGINLFDTKIELYYLAPLIGLKYGRKIQTADSGGEKRKSTIQLQQVKNYEQELIFAYRIVMLLDNKENLNYEERLDRAFRDEHDEKKFERNMKIFNQYVLGGIEFLYNYFSNDYVKPSEKFNLSDKQNLLLDLMELMDFDTELYEDF